jgi:futalosine hydrolase
MRILIVSATRAEIEPYIKWLEYTGRSHDQLYHYHYKGYPVDVLMTGVGMVATAFHLGTYFAQFSPELAINTGIAGTFDPSVSLGSVFSIVEDQFSGFGALENGGFKTVFDLGLLDPDKFPFINGKLQNHEPLPLALTNASTYIDLNRIAGFTTNTIRETFPGAEKPGHTSGAGLESMEGAAFFYACISSHIPAVQLRAVSNIVGERDKSRWMISRAIDNLGQTLQKLLIEIYQ